MRNPRNAGALPTCISLYWQEKQLLGTPKNARQILSFRAASDSSYVLVCFTAKCYLGSTPWFIFSSCFSFSTQKYFASCTSLFFSLKEGWPNENLMRKSARSTIALIYRIRWRDQRSKHSFQSFFLIYFADFPYTLTIRHQQASSACSLLSRLLLSYHPPFQIIVCGLSCAWLFHHDGDVKHSSGREAAALVMQR